MDTMQAIQALCIGIGLAAACGFRVFVPLLVAGISVKAQMWSVDPSMAWIGSWPALIAFGSATALEIAGYYVPWVDNMLDTIATPSAAIAGTLVTATFITGMDPMSKWALAVIAGGGVATGVQTLTVVTRGISSVTTAGFGNPIVSTTEAGAATVLSVLAIIVPLLAGVLVLLLLALGVRWIIVRRRRRAALATTAMQPEAPPT